MNAFPFPKVELHLHLDGSIPAETWWRIAHREGVEMPVDTLEEFYAWLKKTSECSSVPEYLERFDLPLQIMQTEDNIAEITAALIGDLAAKGYGYAEIRCGSRLHAGGGEGRAHRQA